MRIGRPAARPGHGIPLGVEGAGGTAGRLPRGGQSASRASGRQPRAAAPPCREDSDPGTAGVEALRADPSPLAGLGVREVFDHLAEVIEGLGTKPVI
ncbi:hypothetical protein GCM10010302_30110 [Streptomyces polychromogenes]|uniref:Uncharacterized protein n=1 Tax=Streptomyces polychromogenes TaxID=67342 RepID=A0ABN0VDA4_9ACTN